MPFQLSQVPGFSDLPDSTLEAELPALGVLLSRIAGNAAFGMVRPEIFYGVYANGEEVNLPKSTVDGYQYQRSECLYAWGILSTVKAETGWISGPGALWYCAWKVDQATGAVSCSEFYRKSEGSDAGTSAASGDGVLGVFTIAQRQAKTLTVEQSPDYLDLSGPIVFPEDAALHTTPLKQLNHNAKYAVISAEVIYMGEFTNGQVIPRPISPADGYQYDYGETMFQACWRWTTTGAQFTEPDRSYGQLHRIESSIDPTNGTILTQVTMYQSGAITTSWGRVAVFAFCQRSGATVTEITVPSTAMPWVFDGGINASYPYGAKNGTAPVVLPFNLEEGDRLEVTYLLGQVRMSDSRPLVDAAGQASYNTTTQMGSTGFGFPGHYLGGAGRLGRAVGAFVNSAGVVIAAVDVGLSAVLVTPAGATRFQMGVDDDNFRDNTGYFKFSVRVGVDTTTTMGDAGPLDFRGPTVVFTTGNLELSSLWLQPGDVGNSGGGDPHGAKVGTFTPGSPGIFHVQGFDPYDNAYWYIKWRGLTSAMYFVHHMRVKLPTSGDRAACRAIEWEIQKSFNGRIYNMAWQCDFADHKWRSFTKVYPLPGHWDDSGLAFDGSIFDGGAWVELTSVFKLTATTVEHVSLKINSTQHDLHIVRTAPVHQESDYISTAFQLDENGNDPPTPYNCYADQLYVAMYTDAPVSAGGTGELVLPTTMEGEFEEIPEQYLFPGRTLPASLMDQINKNVKFSVVRQEFFGPASFGHGATVPLPISPIDGYAYARNELAYVWEWRSTGPEVSGGIRFWEFDGNVSDAGLVTLHESRNPTGGGIQDTHDGSMRVITIGVRNSAQGDAYEPDPDIDPRPPGDIGSEGPGLALTTTPEYVVYQDAGDPTHLKSLAFSASFESGIVRNYNARTFTIPDPGDTPLTYYISIYDPDALGDDPVEQLGDCTWDDTNARSPDDGWVFAGKIIATHAGGHTGSRGGRIGLDQTLVTIG